ncbi:MAG: phosphomannomutase/phosphoglucomutase, partial [Ruminococcus sp.]|nr:phosphomannomutase/phosphoglucomutase [Ruminococcus sp.]
MSIEKKYLKLQNGSDVRGVALEGIEGENVNLTPEIAQNIASAFAEYLAEKSGKEMESLTISVGHDSRLSADMLKSGVLTGLQKQGCKPIDCELSSTPSMFMSTVLPELDYDGAIMITASHLPFNRNGMKFFSKEGGLESKEIKIILNKAIAVEECGLKEHAEKEIEKLDLLAHYSANLRKIISAEIGKSEEEKPLQGMHFVVDASNGAGGFFATQVLKPLGADISGSIYLNPDGTFPNHVPNPENKKAMECISKATLENNADLGIIFDTDVDRAATVFPSGKEVNKNTIIALMSAIVAQKNPGSTIVTDSVTSDQLHDFLENKLGLKHHRFKRGYRNVINESVRLNNEGIESSLAIETSGHGALKENYFLDDGAYMSVKILCEAVRCKMAGKSIEDMLEGLEEPMESKEFRMGIKLEEFKDYGLKILDDFLAF